MLEQKGMSRADLDDVMEGKSRVSEFFSGKRELSKTQVEVLRSMLGILANILLGLDTYAGLRTARRSTTWLPPPRLRRVGW